MVDFQKFGEISRLSRKCIITEKIDGTNGLIYIGENSEFLTGSHSRWITPENDNHGFSRWANEHKEELMQLGVGFHYGEWWGSGIQRGYGLVKGEKRFSLFNTGIWVKDRTKSLEEKQQYCPECCFVVPILSFGMFETRLIEGVLQDLKRYGSIAAPGFMNPEGIVIFHTQGRLYFKKTILNDDKPKNLPKEK